MIYAGNSNEMTKVREALIAQGVSEENADIGMEFLDLSRERDYSILDKITEKSLRVCENGITEEMHNAYLKCIDGSKNDELMKRYAIFCYVVSGCMGSNLMPTVFSNSASWANNKLIEALNEYTGNAERAETIYNAMGWCLGFSWKGAYDGTDSCIAVAKELMDTNNALGLKLSLRAFDHMRGENAEQIRELCGLIRFFLSRNDYVRERMHEVIAIAITAPYDEDSRRELRAMWDEVSDRIFSIFARDFFTRGRLALSLVNMNLPVSESHILDMFEHFAKEDLASITVYAKKLAAEHTELFVSALLKLKKADVARKMYETLCEVKPEYKANDLGLKKLAEERFLDAISSSWHTDADVMAYIRGEKSLDESLTAIRSFGGGTLDNDKPELETFYYAYGGEPVLRRCLAVAVLKWGTDWQCRAVRHVLLESYKVCCETSDVELQDMLFAENVPVADILGQEFAIRYLVPYAETIAAADFNSLSAAGKCCYVETLFEADKDKYRSELLAAVNDSSKNLRISMVKIIPQLTDWQPEVVKMLTSKKAAVRETAVAIMEDNAGDWSDALKNAYDKEKSDKLKARMAAIMGMEQQSNNDGNVDISGVDALMQLAETMTKGNKARKVEWLFKDDFKPVHFIGGGDVPKNYLMAMLLSYAAEEHEKGRLFGNSIVPEECAAFAHEVMGRWLLAGAAAKEKWVLIFAAVHGDSEMVRVFVHYIKEWSENMRGAMAAAAVKALALNGGSEALMQVDSIARKFKSNQVKYAANEAMAEAAEFLGITPEELADRIVPDFGFDERMCRTFDYGGRQFSVYLTPSLELEIYNGDKAVKNMPKPGVNDDSSKAEKAYAAFKDMKKQLKTAVTVQKARLEYALMCERRWTAENWEKLFVKNPVMHCFAIGLIWGVYEDGELAATFRYMDDGSFTTVDEEEFTLPENAVISLVHPVELTAEERDAWSEQLSDYEIVQPIPQLSRDVYSPAENEVDAVKITRFNGKTAVNLTLMSKLLKLGWYKGRAEDAGFFYYFDRTDVSRRVKNDRGESVNDGWGADLSFSGMYIGAYGEEPEEITVGELTFRRLSDSECSIPAGKVSKRYFSEIIMQISSIVES